MVICSDSEYNDLFLSEEAVVWIIWVVVLMLLCPFLFHFSFKKRFSSAKLGVVSGCSC